MAVTVEKFSPGDINPDRFLAELRVALPGIDIDVLFAGLERSTRRLMIRFTENREIGRNKDSTGLVIDTADPGELRFTTEVPLTGPQDTELDGVVAGHDPALLTIEQQREDKDAAVIVQITFNLQRANWDALNNAQQRETLRRSCQLLFRNNIVRAFDTND